MDAFVSRKKRRLSGSRVDRGVSSAEKSRPSEALGDEESTELKLAVLASLYPSVEQEVLLDVLLAKDGSVEQASEVLSTAGSSLPVKKSQVPASNTYQSSLASLRAPDGPDGRRTKPLTRKGRTLHLFSPEDVAQHTPCSIIHNFLRQEEANDLLKELLEEARTFESATFKIFDNVVTSPHSACFYVQNLEEERKQRTEYLYNGSYLSDIRQITPHMRQVSSRVQEAVNREIATRIKTQYPGRQKLRYQSARPWVPNAAFVNCYDGGSQSVGYHSDQLTYLGPRPVIGSLSLGVSREFRVRKIVPREDASTDTSSAAAAVAEGKPTRDEARADVEGQIAIHLPHNSLVVMHAEMQEEWKHSIAPALAIDPHPIAGSKRINVTYRCYRDTFHPRFTPRCKCSVPTVLRCVQRRKENRGRYFWMCHAGLKPGKEGCVFFEWADFDDDGEPPWQQDRPPEVDSV